MKKTLLLYPLIYISTVLLCLLFLLAATLIPQEAIREKAAQSAKYFYENDLFPKEAGDLENFKKDNYADCISTGIAWHLGEGNAFEAVMSGMYNRVQDENVHVSFYKEMQGEESATTPYSRYWHGSAGVIRVLLLLADISTIRYVIATVGLILNASLVITLLRRRQKALGIAYGIAFLLVNGLFALTCLEYTFIFLLVPIFALFLITNKQLEKAQNAQLTFLVIGILTSYFDFLTTETLTFTVPFAIYYITVAMETKWGQEKKKQWFLFIKSGICWICGYAGMFMTKWVLATLCLGKDAWNSALMSATERLGSELPAGALETGEALTYFGLVKGILIRNLGCLYWGSSDMKTGTVIYITIGIALLVFIIWYMLRKEKKGKENVVILVLLAVLPYVRMIAVLNHSYIHYFFTYRAQMITVIIVLYLLYCRTWLSEGFRQRK